MLFEGILKKLIGRPKRSSVADSDNTALSSSTTAGSDGSSASYSEISPTGDVADFVRREDVRLSGYQPPPSIIPTNSSCK